VRWVDQLDPGSCESEISWWLRRSVERVSCESERGRGALFVVSAHSAFVGGAFGVVFLAACLS
jgi:hypothetical protein